MSLRAKVATAALTVAVATAVVTAAAPAAPAIAPVRVSTITAMPAPVSVPVSVPPAATVVEEPDTAPTVSVAPSYVTREYLLPSGRSYLLRTVVGPGPRRPLVVLLHGLGLDPAAMQGMTGATEFADEHGFALAYGVGVDKAWNAGTCCAPFTSSGTTTPEDDVAYLRELVAHASATTAVDRSRVYAWGYSNGGMMAWRAVCEIGDVFAAAGVVGGQLTVECGQSTVAVVHIHGLADTTVPWRGGWSEHLGMDLPAGLLEGFRVGPGSTVEHLTWDGGHTWPEWAIEALWEFSSRYSLPLPYRGSVSR